MEFKKGKYAGKTYREIIRKDIGYIAWLIETYGQDFETRLLENAGELYRVHFRKFREEKGEKEAQKYPRSIELIKEDSGMIQLIRKINRIEALLVEVLDRLIDEEQKSKTSKTKRGSGRNRRS